MIRALSKIQPNLLNATNERIIAACGTIGCCTRCVLRYLGCRDSDVHRQFEPTVESMSNQVVSVDKMPSVEKDGDSKRLKLDEQSIDSDLKAQSSKTCPSCLGMLQLEFGAISKQGMRLFEEQNYLLKNQTFSLSVQIPPQIIIRHHSTNHYIAQCIKVIDEEPIPAAIEVKEILKYLCRDAFAEESKLSIEKDIAHEESELDYQFLQQIPEAKFDYRKGKKQGKTIHHGASNEKVARSCELIKYEQFAHHNQCPPPSIHTSPKVVNLEFIHSQIYVAGRYCKLERMISNSCFIIKGKRITEHSVEELIGDILTPYFRNSKYKFSSAGREDTDVLMLGRGRPFYFELINPHRTFADAKALSDLQKHINESVSESTSIMKDSASTKCKSYTCWVQLGEAVSVSQVEELSKKKDIQVSQKNPTRVPRRADLIREKIIHEIQIAPIDAVDNMCRKVRVDLKTSAGTYVKEFMHGDEGRTTPCLYSLLNCKSATVINLDVTEIFLDWPAMVE